MKPDLKFFSAEQYVALLDAVLLRTLDSKLHNNYKLDREAIEQRLYGDEPACVNTHMHIMAVLDAAAQSPYFGVEIGNRHRTKNEARAMVDDLLHGRFAPSEEIKAYIDGLDQARRDAALQEADCFLPLQQRTFKHLPVPGDTAVAEARKIMGKKEK